MMGQVADQHVLDQLGERGELVAAVEVKVFLSRLDLDVEDLVLLPGG